MHPVPLSCIIDGCIRSNSVLARKEEREKMKKFIKLLAVALAAAALAGCSLVSINT